MKNSNHSIRLILPTQMTKSCISIFLFLSLVALVESAKLTVPTGHRHSRVRAFVESQCQPTRYPKLCVHCLSTYINSTTQSPQQLAHVALRVSLARANYARVYLIKVAKDLRRSKAKEYQAMKDCLDQISDGVHQLTRSIEELQQIEKEDEFGFVWHQSNVQSWTSAALTDALTCMDGFSGYSKGGKTRAIVKAKVLNVAQVTSNALALFGRYVTKHHTSHSVKPQP